MIRRFQPAAGADVRRAAKFDTPRGPRSVSGVPTIVAHGCNAAQDGHGADSRAVTTNLCLRLAALEARFKKTQHVVGKILSLRTPGPDPDAVLNPRQGAVLPVAVINILDRFVRIPIEIGPVVGDIDDRRIKRCDSLWKLC